MLAFSLSACASFNPVPVLPEALHLLRSPTVYISPLLSTWFALLPSVLPPQPRTHLLPLQPGGIKSHKERLLTVVTLFLIQGLSKSSLHRDAASVRRVLTRSPPRIAQSLGVRAIFGGGWCGFETPRAEVGPRLRGFNAWMHTLRPRQMQEKKVPCHLWLFKGPLKSTCVSTYAPKIKRAPILLKGFRAPSTTEVLNLTPWD